ncbi:peptidase M10A [Actinokineospora sp. NBRC 105648]|uniref:peptidase M10A n=1 Tax=Actinokineospora sp. NBRC 105648 TaxID=3032206 RepID=UPI0024A2D209|nr:peptidase M10A [Actinokineospora sp. NBRC 105648]GLZ38815.1 hypothetical protein Acsp05_24390 [Actinokineospora sp. NBRC 105648]
MRRQLTALAALALTAAAVTVAAQQVSSTSTAAAADQEFVVATALTVDDLLGGSESTANTTSAATATTDTACTDTTYVAKAWRVTGTWTWYYNGTGAPAAVANTALATITSAGDTVSTGANRCGLPANLATVFKYAGTATAKPQIGTDLSCTGNDGKSVTGWGALPAKVLAYTCTYYNSKGVVTASDVLIDNVAYTWFTTKPATCTGAQYDLQTTMTHERLHTAGLGHVDQTANAAQVMTPASAPCDTSRRLLGAGDYAGLKALAARK